jgi:hypothetical protein
MKALVTIALSISTMLLIAQPRGKWDGRDSILAEYHKDAVLPLIYEEPIFQIENEAWGWSFTSDKQWISATGKIPLQGLSTDSRLYSSSEAEVGQDNFKSMRIYLMRFGEDTFYVYTKIYEQGFYRYPITKKGWKTRTDLYYSIIRKPESQDLIAQLPLDTNLHYSFSMYDERVITNVRAKQDPLPLIRKKLFMTTTDRKFVVQLERKNNQQLRFLTYSIHPTFDDPMGLVKDHKVLNKSIYGVSETLDKVHYTVLESEWSATVLP